MLGVKAGAARIGPATRLLLSSTNFGAADYMANPLEEWPANVA